jgi:hypothetical protein
MAFIKDFNEEDKQAGQQLSGSSGSVSSAPTGGGSGPAQPTGNAGSGWTNLQTYLGANQGQAGGLADQIGQDANKKVDEFKDTKADSTVADINKQSRTDEAQGYTGDVAKNADQVKNFLSSGWGGKDTNTYTEGVRNQANQVKGTLGQLNNQGYQKATLQRLNNTPTQAYSSGFGALDSFLVNADPNARAKLTMTQGRGQEVDQTLNNFTDQVSNAVAGSKKQFDDNKQLLRGATSAQYNNLMGGAQGRVGSVLENQGEDARARAGGIVNSRTAGNPLLSGVSVDVNPFVKQNTGFGVSDVATDAEIEALNRLAGIDSNLGLSGLQRTNNQAFSIDESGLQGWLGNKETEAKAAIDAENKRKADEAAAREAAKVNAGKAAQSQQAASSTSSMNAAAAEDFKRRYGVYPPGYTVKYGQR